MGSYFFKFLVAMLLCIFHGQISSLGFNSPTHVKCIESERQALLNFKQGLIDDYGTLSTWTNNDCCKWKGIQCNNETGHVHVLDLRCQDTQYLTGAINIASLIHLQHIEYLDLSNNDFQWSQIPQLMGSFTNLRYLNLSSFVFGGSIPSELGKLTLIQYLDLSKNDLYGEIPYQLGNLAQLRYLDLQLNSLNGTIPYQLGNLSQLRYLDLQRNSLNGTIPYQLGNLSQLRHLNLQQNSLNGAIPSQLGKLTSLRYLRLDYNFDLKVNDAKWLTSLTSLTTLGLSGFPNVSSSRKCIQIISELIPNLRELRLADCQLSDHNISSLFHSQYNLSILHLSSNMPTSSTFHLLSNYSLHLQILDLGSNKLQGEIPAFLGNICTLQALYLNNNNLSGEISSFINNYSRCNRHVFQTSLRRLDLSNNQFTGEIPKSIGLLYELESLYLHENHLEGNITESHLRNLSKLKDLDLTDNSLSLKFGTTWVPTFQLYTLGLASCKLGPSFPSWLQAQSQLVFLDISDAGIDDFVPEWFWNKLQSITLMNMSYNSLKGTIPNLPIKLNNNGHRAFLNSNQFEGRIPTFLSQADTLDLSKNKISDFNTFLCGKSAATNMRSLDLSNNQIMGQLPDCLEHLKESLEYLDLSNNKLSGKIPQSIGALVNLKALVSRNNSLTGGLPLPLKNCTSLVIFDVSENLLSGPIPSWIGESLLQLKILSLRVNSFFGSVPVNLCYLRQIHLFDLSRNNLLGEIPTCLTNFTAMMERSIIPTWEIVRERKMNSRVTNMDTYDSNVLLMWKGQEYVFLNPEIFLMSIDLSSNSLTGEIPKEVGYLLGLVSLNLARNNLHGEIPSGIGNLNSLDFLDLSRNHFSGKIPSTLSKIDFLGYLNLSNNDLSGRIPWEGHLRTFDASHFDGNLDLCGEPLNRSCAGDQTMLKPQGDVIPGEDDNSVFYEALYMSLGIGFFAGFWGLLGPMLLWQPWRITYLQFLNRLRDYILVTVEVKVEKCRRWLKG